MPAAEFCLIALGDEIYGEIGFVVISVGEDYRRDLRVVVDVIFGLITCAAVEVGIGSQTKNDLAESRTPGLKASIRIAEVASPVKLPKQREGEHRGYRMGTAERADETCMDVSVQRKTLMTRYSFLSQCAHTRSAHKVCRVTMTLNNEKKCACNRWCCVQLRRASDQALGWKRTGESAELIRTQPKFDPKTIWLIIDSLDAIKWACVWAGHALDNVVQRFTAPFVNMVRQRFQELHAIESQCEAAVRENLHHRARR